MPKKRISYALARRDENERQNFLDLLLPYASRSVSSMIYDPIDIRRQNYIEYLGKKKLISRNIADFLKESKSGLPIEVIYNNSLLGRGDRHPIFVFENAFTSFKSPQQFYSYLFDYFNTLTDNLRYGLDIDNSLTIDVGNVQRVSLRSFALISHFTGLNKQIEYLNKRKIEASLQRKIFAEASCTLDAIEDIVPINLFEEEVLNRMSQTIMSKNVSYC